MYFKITNSDDLVIEITKHKIFNEVPLCYKVQSSDKVIKYKKY